MALSLPNPDLGLLMTRLAGMGIARERGKKRQKKKEAACLPSLPDL